MKNLTYWWSWYSMPKAASTARFTEEQMDIPESWIQINAVKPNVIPVDQSTASSTCFQVFDVHSSEAPLAEMPPPKRKRVEFSKCEYTDELRLMWIYLEGLAAQFGVLIEVTQVWDPQDSITYQTVLAGAAVISHNVPVLQEEKEEVNLHYKSPSSILLLSRGYRCPAFNCARYFQRMDRFYQHIRGSDTDGHKILKNIIDQTCCLWCDKSFTCPQDLVKHERSVHREQYTSRVFKFTGCQDDQGQGDQGQGDQDRDGQGQGDQGGNDSGPPLCNTPQAPTPPTSLWLSCSVGHTEI